MAQLILRFFHPATVPVCLGRLARRRPPTLRAVLWAPGVLNAPRLRGLPIGLARGARARGRMAHSRLTFLGRA